VIKGVIRSRIREDKQIRRSGVNIRARIVVVVIVI